LPCATSKSCSRWGAVFLLNYALQSWLPTLLQESGFTLESSGRLVALCLVAAMATNFFVPSFTRQGYRGPMPAGMLASSAAITAGLAFASGGTLVALVVVGSMIRFPALQLLTLVLMDTPEVGMRRLATTTGIFFAVAEVGGFTGPLMMGLVRDATGELTGGVIALAVVTTAMAPLSLLLRERRG
jgi:cyanate permease